MRRLLAVVLLCWFGLLPVSATMTARTTAEAQFPACCRTHGKHRCQMLGQPGGDAENGTHAASVSERCPYRSGALVPVSPAGRNGEAAKKSAAYEDGGSRFVPHPAAVSARSLLITRTHPKRGPPISA